MIPFLWVLLKVTQFNLELGKNITFQFLASEFYTKNGILYRFIQSWSVWYEKCTALTHSRILPKAALKESHSNELIIFHRASVKCMRIVCILFETSISHFTGFFFHHLLGFQERSYCKNIFWKCLSFMFSWYYVSVRYYNYLKTDYL